MSYTKGEWKVELSKDPLRMPDRVFADGNLVASVRGDPDNSHLIAAAPDMYEALKLFNERFNDMEKKYSYPMSLDLPRIWMEKVLAKAEGK